MAHLTNCIYCSCSVLNSNWHPECRIAYLEDLLYKIKLINNDNGDLWQNREVRGQLGRENFRSWADFERAKEDDRIRQLEEQMEEIRRHAKISAFIASLDKKEI